MTGTTEHTIWKSMRRRCSDPSVPEYKNYGGRGIKVCSRWDNSFLTFYHDMGARPEGLTLDRINNNGDYEPSNCRWATRVEQCITRRKTVLNKSGFKGVSYDRSKDRWVATMAYNGKKVLRTYHKTKLQAVDSRKDAELKYYANAIV